MWDYSTDFCIFKLKLILITQYSGDPQESGKGLGSADANT